MPRGISWSFNETEALIRLWADSSTQTALRLNSRNRCIYEDIANQLQALGVIRTADQCQMRIKLLKKMYRQTNEAMKRGDVFQQRPCPFYNEMDRIFSGNDDSTNPSGLSNSQSSLLEEEEDDIDEDIEPTDENQIFTNETSSNGDKFAQAIDRLIEYQKQNEERWYAYLDQQATLESQRRQEDRAYHLQLIQFLTNALASKTTPSSSSSSVLPMLQQFLMNTHSPMEQLSPQQEDRGEKRKSSPKMAKAKHRSSTNFYSLLAQIHNINNMDDTN